MSEDPCKSSSIHEGCREVWQKWSGFLDGELAPEEKDRVAKHLADCDHCNEYINSQSSFNRLLTHAMAEHCCGSVTQTLRVRVMAALEKNFGVPAAPAAELSHGHSHSHARHHHGHDHHHHEHEHALAGAGGLRTVRVPMYALVVLALACAAVGGGIALVAGGAGKPGDAVNARVRALATRGAAKLSGVSGGEDQWNIYVKKHGEMYAGAAMPRMNAKPSAMTTGTLNVGDHDSLYLACDWGESRHYVLLTCPSKMMDSVAPTLDRAEFKVDDKLVMMWREGDVCRALVTTGGADWARAQVAALTK